MRLYSTCASPRMESNDKANRNLVTYSDILIKITIMQFNVHVHPSTMGDPLLEGNTDSLMTVLLP